MISAIAKRSVVLRGHKTSVSLEHEFWIGLREIAELQKAPLTALLEKIDGGRSNANLSSAIRLYVYEYYRSRAAVEPERRQTRRGPAPGATGGRGR